MEETVPSSVDPSTVAVETDDVTCESNETLDKLVKKTTSAGKTLTKAMIKEARGKKETARTSPKLPTAEDGSGTIEKDPEESKKSPKPMKTVRCADTESMSSQRAAMHADTSTITKEEEDVYKIIQKARSVLSDDGELLDESAFLPNQADVSFISDQLQHEDCGAALSVFERESDDRSWKPLQDDDSVQFPKGGEASITLKWATQIASHTLNTDACMTQIRCLATEVQKDVLWCRRQVDRVAEATFEAEIQGLNDQDVTKVGNALSSTDHHFNYMSLMRLQTVMIVKGWNIKPYVGELKPNESIITMTLNILHGSGVMNIGHAGLAESHTKGFGQEL